MIVTSWLASKAIVACNSPNKYRRMMTTHSPIGSRLAIAAAVLLTVASCKKESAQPSGNHFASLLFDASSPAAREALATPVDFRLTESNYAQWEQAQRFLDNVPRSAFVSGSGASGNAIDRAVQTLEASPRARTAIERTGLTVRDFVLETIALAQAEEAGSGRTPAGVVVPPENVQFVQRYQSQILQARVARAERARADAYGQADTTNFGAETPVNDQRGEVAPPDSAAAGDHRTDSTRRAGQPSEPKPPSDTARDTIPR